MLQSNARRRCALLAAAAFLLPAAAGAFPAAAEDTGYIFCDSFEDGASGWSGRGAAKTALSHSTAYEGSGSLSVTGRSASWNGAAKPLSNLQSSGEQGCFNTRFLEFRDPQQLPVDQHMLGALCADPNRYLFIIASCQGENWVNAPSMWMSYLGMRHVWDYLGLSDHLAINVHLSGHAVIEEDMKYMCQYFDRHVYGIEPKDDLSKLQTSVFALPKNSDPIWNTFTNKWLY